MSKRIVSLILAALIMSLALLPAAAEDNTPDSSAGYYYVYTENGKGLNVRKTPGGEVVGSLKYGTRIYCYYKDGGNGWALIDYTYDMPGVGRGTYACFISSRYLRKTKPPARTKATPAPVQNTVAGASDLASEINAEFASAKTVTPYKVTVRPTRASGWVSMHWAPSTNAELMATYAANTQLVVLKETANWLQVENQSTYDVGFINKAYVTK